MIDLTKPHNWIAIAAMLLLLGFLFHQLGKRVPAVGNVVAASFGS